MAIRESGRGRELGEVDRQKKRRREKNTEESK